MEEHIALIHKLKKYQDLKTGKLYDTWNGADFIGVDTILDLQPSPLKVGVFTFYDFYTFYVNGREYNVYPSYHRIKGGYTFEFALAKGNYRCIDSSRVSFFDKDAMSEVYPVAVNTLDGVCHILYYVVQGCPEDIYLTLVFDIEGEFISTYFENPVCEYISKHTNTTLEAKLRVGRYFL